MIATISPILPWYAGCHDSILEETGQALTQRASRMNPTTPDGRYFVVKGRLRRCSNPALDGQVRQRLVNELMEGIRLFE
jgi:hypothetical protein